MERSGEPDGPEQFCTPARPAFHCSGAWPAERRNAPAAAQSARQRSALSFLPREPGRQPREPHLDAAGLAFRFTVSRLGRRNDETERRHVSVATLPSIGRKRGGREASFAFRCRHRQGSTQWQSSCACCRCSQCPNCCTNIGKTTTEAGSARYESVTIKCGQLYCPMEGIPNHFYTDEEAIEHASYLGFRSGS